MGSGNPGSTNILRNYGFKYGVLNLALDMVKGFVLEKEMIDTNKLLICKYLISILLYSFVNEKINKILLES